jgi:hypothetical protein
MKALGVAMHRLKDDAEVRSVIDAVRAAPNGEVASIERRIAAFETAYGMTSAEMATRVERGELGTTQDVETWLMAVRVKDHLAGVKARGR